MPLRQNYRPLNLSLESTSPSSGTTMSSRDSSVQRSGLESPVTRSGTSSTISSSGNFMGLQCSFYGCTRLCLTGGPFCTLHSEVNRRASSNPTKSSSATDSPARLSPIDLITRKQGNTGPNISTHSLNISRLPHESSHHKTHTHFQDETTQNAPRTSNTEPPTNKPGKFLNSKATARKGAQNPLKSNSAAQIAPSITVAISPQTVQNTDGKQPTLNPTAEPPLKRQRVYIEKDDTQLRSQSLPRPIYGLKHLGSNVNGVQSIRNGPLPTANGSFSLRPEKKTEPPIGNRTDNDVRSAAEAGRESGHNQSFFSLIDNGDTPAANSAHGRPHATITERTDPMQTHRNYSDKLPSILHGYPFGDTSWNMPPIRKPVDDLKIQRKWSSSQPQPASYPNRFSRSPDSRGSPASSQLTRDHDEGQVQKNGSALKSGQNRHFRPKPKARVQRSANSTNESQEGDPDRLLPAVVQSPRNPKSVGQHPAPKMTMPEIVDLTSDMASDTASYRLLPPKPKPSSSRPLEVASSMGIDKSAGLFSKDSDERLFCYPRRSEPILEAEGVSKNKGPCSFESSELLISRRTESEFAIQDKVVEKACNAVFVAADGPLVQGHRKGASEPERFIDPVPDELSHAVPPDPKKPSSEENNEIDKLSAYIYGPLNEPNRPGSALFGLPPSVSTRPAAHFRHFDPRVHWTKARPQLWYNHKQSEIATRGNRKSQINVKLAVAGSARQKDVGRLHQELPSKVHKSPGWVAALDELDIMAESFRANHYAEEQRKEKEKVNVAQEVNDCLVRGHEWAADGSTRTSSTSRESRGAV